MAEDKELQSLSKCCGCAHQGVLRGKSEVQTSAPLSGDEERFRFQYPARFPAWAENPTFGGANRGFERNDKKKSINEDGYPMICPNPGNDEGWEKIIPFSASGRAGKTNPARKWPLIWPI